MEKKAILDNMDLSMLVLDEVCDDGVVLETDAAAIVSRCAFKSDELPFADQSISQVGMSVSKISIYCSLAILLFLLLYIFRFWDLPRINSNGHFLNKIKYFTL